MSETKTHWKKLDNPEYLGAYSFQPNEEKVVEIVRVEMRSVPNTDGKKSDCKVAILKNEKPMILNSINCRTLHKVYGTPYIEDWQGKSIVICVDPKVKAFGEIVEGIRIKPIKPPLPELTPDHPKWAEAVKAVKADPKAIDKVVARYSLSPANLKLIQQ